MRLRICVSWTILAALGAWGQATTTVTLGLTGTGSGSGLPGYIDAKLRFATLIAGSNGNETQIPLGVARIYGDSTSTEIVLAPAAAACDELHFHDSAASLNDLGRAGTATLTGSGGAFQKATASLSYTLTCTQVCFGGSGKPVAGIFALSFTANGSLTLPTTTAQDVLPSIVPAELGDQEAEIEAAANEQTITIDETKSMIQNTSGQGLFRKASAAPGSLSVAVTPPWQPVKSTFTANATCPGLSTACWISTPTPAGNIAPFSNTPVEVNVDLTNLPAGVYQSNFALTVTPADGSSAPTTETMPFTVVVGNGSPFLHLSETGVQFQAVAGAPQSGPVHQITLSTSGAAVPYALAASTISGSNWLSVTPASGSTSSSGTGIFNIIANPAGLAAGQYFGRVDIAAPSASTPLQSVEVELTVLKSAPAAPVFSPGGVIFVAAQNTNPTAQLVTVSTLSTTPIAITSQASGDDLSPWLKTAASGTSIQAGLPVKETLSVTTTGLAPGIYTGTLYVEATATSTAYPVAVTLIVTPPAGSTCTPAQLIPTLTAPSGGFEFQAALPVTLTAQIVDDCGAALASGGVQASFSTGDSPVTMMPLGNGLWSGTWNPRNLAGGGAVISIAAQSTSGLAGSTSTDGTLDANSTAAVVLPGGIVNAANPVSGAALSPGEFISIYGSNFSSSSMSSGSPPLMPALGGTQVLLAGQPMPLQFVNSGLINAVVPFATPMNGIQELLVSQNGAYALPEKVVVATASPAVFTQAQTGQGAGVIVVIKADGTAYETSPTQPASTGDLLLLYCSGLGPVDPPAADGQPGPSSEPFAATVNPVTATIGGQPAHVGFAGLAPGYAGVYQVNVTVPKGVAPGTDVPVVLTVAGFSSSPVTVTIQ